MATTTLSLRRHYDLYLTNTKDNSYGAHPYQLLFPTAPTFRGTPRQILAEIAEYRRISGGCFIGVRITDPRTGEEISQDEMRMEVSFADAGDR